MRVVFVVVALGFAAAALFHAAALVAPSIAEPAPPWRHALFVVVNGAFALGMWRRPRGFAWAFAALTAQQLYSHGTYAAELSRRAGRVDWASVVVVVAMPAVLALLVAERVVRAREVRGVARASDARSPRDG